MEWYHWLLIPAVVVAGVACETFRRLANLIADVWAENRRATAEHELFHAGLVDRRIARDRNRIPATWPPTPDQAKADQLAAAHEREWLR